MNKLDALEQRLDIMKDILDDVVTRLPKEGKTESIFEYLNKFDVSKLDALRTKFEIGKWYTSTAIVFRVIGLSESQITYDKISTPLIASTNFYIHSLIGYNSVPSTSVEIESHLIAVAERKYAKNVFVRCIESQTIKKSLDRDYIYSNDTDSLYVLGEENNRICNLTLYQKGKWAEIVSDKKNKKCLPKTKAEFKYFLSDAFSDKTGLSIETVGFINNFLDDYED